MSAIGLIADMLLLRREMPRRANSCYRSASAGFADFIRARQVPCSSIARWTQLQCEVDDIGQVVPKYNGPKRGRTAVEQHQQNAHYYSLDGIPNACPPELATLERERGIWSWHLRGSFHLVSETIRFRLSW